MNIIEALRTEKPLRRPIAKHWGSHGTGWLGNEYIKAILTRTLFEDFWIAQVCSSVHLLTESDIMADDWEVKD